MVRPIACAIGWTWGEVASAAADLSGCATISGENHECDAHAGSREPRGRKASNDFLPTGHLQCRFGQPVISLRSAAV